MKRASQKPNFGHAEAHLLSSRCVRVTVEPRLAGSMMLRWGRATTVYLFSSTVLVGHRNARHGAD